MTLSLVGAAARTVEAVDHIVYTPGLADSGDLEAGTKSVTATSQQGTPDYSADLTVPAPSDGRVQVERLALRGLVHIDSFGGAPAATKLFYTLKVNGVAKVTGGELTSAAADNLFALDVTADFLLGSPNDVDLHLWVDQGDAIVSVAQLWLAVGAVTTGEPARALLIGHHGLLSLTAVIERVGSGSPTITLTPPSTGWYVFASASGTNGRLQLPAFVCRDNPLRLSGTVATDLNYLSALYLNLRRLLS
jgi:hypothetical protein